MGLKRVRHDLATEPPPPSEDIFPASRCDPCESKAGARVWKGGYVASSFGVLECELGHLSVPFVISET